MRRATVALVVAGLLLAGCGSDVNDNTEAACQGFANAYADQKTVMAEKGPQEDYDDATTRIANALNQGAASASGSLKDAFQAGLDGWQADHDAGGFTDEDKLVDLYQGYELVLTQCKEAGVDL